MDSIATSDSEEEIIVYAEVQENINLDKQRNIHVLGINDKHPVVQMGETFFKGTFQSPLGTYMFFEEDKGAKSDDPLFDKLPENNLKYVFKTGKYLNLEHAHVLPKEVGDSEGQSQQQQLGPSIEQVHFESVQEALAKLETSWLPEIAHEVNHSELNISKQYNHLFWFPVLS